MDDVVYCAEDESLRYEGESASLCRCTSHSSVYPGSVLCLETGALTEVKRPLLPQSKTL